ncbi:outer membrane protein transport protein [Falsihalocynthiibacter sp. SS001]|uniref:outer membrane protein transport protein n=1 Tax=Falsihalocynthiibacter sp. SS001 TaxID=3349698 RepID=UPI0036D22CEC
MKHLATTVALLATTAGSAYAGGIQRATDSVLFMFEEGNYAEFEFGTVNADVSGYLDAAPSVQSGDMAPRYNTAALSYKHQLNESWSLGVRLSQPFGAIVDYPSAAATGYPIGGSNADLSVNALTAILRYETENNISVFGGLRVQQAQGEVDLFSGGASAYTMTTDKATDYGYLVGAAWENPAIAARVALTYHSAVTHDLQSTEFGAFATEFETVTPQSVTLEFQTGINESTLFYGSVRWADWSEFQINPPLYAANVSPTPLVSYDDDVITYSLGLGRKFTEKWSGAVTVDYEQNTGGFTGNLGPTNGLASIGLAASYDMDPVTITFGARYVALGDAATQLGGTTTTFSDNSAIGAGVRIGYNF